MKLLPTFIFLFLFFLFYSASHITALSLNSFHPSQEVSANRPGRPNKIPFTIMIDPESNTLPFAQALQKQLEQIARVRVVLTKTSPDEPVRPLQHANFANRLDVDLFFHIRCYEDTHVHPHVAIYSFSYGDYAPSRVQDLAFYTYDQAHLLAINTTQKYVNAFEKEVKRETKHFDFVGAFNIPFKPLIGIKVPAIGLEIGLKNKQSWHNYVAPLAQAIAAMIANV